MQQAISEYRVYMPKAHRLFLEDLEKPGSSLRCFCYRRFGTAADDNVSVELLHNLETSYNDTLNALVRFLSRRFHLVWRFCPSVASTALHAKTEEAMQRARLQLLLMRQRVDQRLYT